MCDAHLVVWTCIVYALASAYVLAFAGGYSNMCLCCVLYVSLGVALGFQVASSCELTYVKVGAALFGLMMFTWCGGLTERVRDSRCISTGIRFYISSNYILNVVLAFIFVLLYCWIGVDECHY